MFFNKDRHIEDQDLVACFNDLGRLEPARSGGLLLDELDNILVVNGVRDAHALRRVLGAGAPHQRVLESARQGPVDGVAHVLDCDALRRQRV
ncbi:jg4046 [Pararge aegeria aegeria]|uniref:Jg4046 protein n=1 Tax=Pararge aegeria aegeria TaxID=348720 RepID=A0A8S4R863_9NEOP|nr:jg4046 [Pararge aegeria aegeria]